MNKEKNLVPRDQIQLVKSEWGVYIKILKEADEYYAETIDRYRDIRKNNKNLLELYKKSEFWDVVVKLCLYIAVKSPAYAEYKIAPLILEIIFANPDILKTIRETFVANGGYNSQLCRLVCFLDQLIEIQPKIVDPSSKIESSSNEIKYEEFSFKNISRGIKKNKLSESTTESYLAIWTAYTIYSNE